MVLIAKGVEFYRHVSEGVQLNYWLDTDETIIAGEWELLYAAPRLTAREIKAFDRGIIQAGTTLIDDICFFCYRVGDAPKLAKGFGSEVTQSKILIGWQECPFTLSLVGYGSKRTDELVLGEFERQRQAYLNDSNLRIFLRLVVVDTETQLVRSLRAFTLSNEFSLALINNAIATAPLSFEIGNVRLKRVFDTYAIGQIGAACQVLSVSGD